MSPEKKYLDVFYYTYKQPVLAFWNGFTVAQGDPTSPTYGNAVLLNGLTQGSAANNRIGLMASFYRFMIRMCIRVPSASPLSPLSQCARVLVILDRAPNGAAPAITDIFEQNPSTYGATTSTYAINSINMTYRNRFKILAQRFYMITPSTDAGAFLCEIVLKKRIKTTYSGTTDRITDIRTNAVWLLCLSEQTSIGGDPSTANVYAGAWTCRSRFMDP